MLFLSIPTTFDNKLLDAVVALNEKYNTKNVSIKEIYGSLQYSVIGSGRNPWDLPPVKMNEIETHIQKAHKIGLQFCYLLNAPCLANIEHTKVGLNKIINFINQLQEVGVDCITITNPYLALLIKTRFNTFKLNTSVYCNINSLHSFNYYQSIGVDRITLSPDIYRNFKLLSEIKKIAQVELQLLVNSSCLFNCPNKVNHANVTGHFSQETTNNKDYQPAFWFNEKCMLKRLEDTSEFIKTPWIRPEDLMIYHQFGIKYFKIAGREYPRYRILKIAEIYMNQDYSGDLSFLLMGFFDSYEFKKPLNFTIDNKKLDNFLEYFIKKDDYDCLTGCNNCNYCQEVAKEAITIDETLKKEYIATFKNKLKERLYEDRQQVSISKIMDNARVKRNILFKVLDKIYKYI